MLSLDGGGTDAGIRALGRLYPSDPLGREIVRDFDFIAANSGGSIAMSALCCNYRPSQIANFYDHRTTLERLFSSNWTARVPGLRDVLPRAQQRSISRGNGANRAAWSSRARKLKLAVKIDLLGVRVRFHLNLFRCDQLTLTVTKL
jgi:hypothetical protein